MALKTCLCVRCGLMAEADEFDSATETCIDCAYDRAAVEHYGEVAWMEYVAYCDAQAALEPDYGPGGIGLVPPTG